MLSMPLLYLCLTWLGATWTNPGDFWIIFSNHVGLFALMFGVRPRKGLDGYNLPSYKNCCRYLFPPFL